MSDVASLYENLSEKARASLDKFQKEALSDMDMYASQSSLTYYCFGYLVGQGISKEEANKACVLAQKKNFWRK
ncbi:MAG TPA: hypothetical protein VM577_11520 [Anaerovoracaceae bacterium]|nr:hypothetical protein [Anaerovoracaceae bacterium]